MSAPVPPIPDSDPQDAPDFFEREGRAFGAAWAGLAETLRSERHFRFEAIFAIVALVLCALLRVRLWGWVAIIGFSALVLSLELVNTALESVCDLAPPARHPLAKRAKDAAAGAVLVASILALLCGIAIYANALFALFAH